MTRTFLVVSGIVACIVAHAVAGGSIAWTEVRARIEKEDPEFLALIERAFDIRSVGGAARVGRDASGKPTVEGTEVGTRTPPYEFPAKIKGSDSLYTLYLIFIPSESGDHMWQVTVRRNPDAD